jgi:hypothetical protein
MKSITFAKLRHMFDNIFEAIFFEWYIRVIDTIWCTDTCEKQTIKIIYLSDRTYRGSWIVRHGLLMDGDRWGESSDLTHMSRLRDI